MNETIVIALLSYMFGFILATYNRNKERLRLQQNIIDLEEYINHLEKCVADKY